MCRIRQCAVPTLTEVINKKRSLSAFLRAVPPEVYVTYSPQLETHYTTSVVDVGSVPLSRAVFYLRASTGVQDVGALIGLGETRSEQEAEVFISKVMQRAKEDAPPALQKLPSAPVQYIVLPSLDPFAGHVLPSLLKKFPEARVVCSSFVAAFLSDSTFFAGASRALRDTCSSNLPFAAISPSLIIDAADGATVALSPPGKSVTPADRKISFVQGDLTARSKRRPSSTLPFMLHDSLLVYDSGSKSVFAGDMCGVRFPWLRFVHDAANPSVVLPVPPPLSRTLSSDPTSPLLLPWDIEESVAIAISALRRVPLAQRVIGSSYGELAIDREALIEQLQASMAALVEVRDRAAKFVEEGKVGNDTQRLLQAVKDKVRSKLILTQTSSSPSPAHSRDAAISFLDEAALDKVGQCIVSSLPQKRQQAGVSVSHTKPSARPSSNRKHDAAVVANKPTPAPRATNPDVEMLVKALQIADLPSEFGVIASREQICPRVFASMTKAELEMIFSPAFGDMKRLHALQEFVSARLPRSANEPAA